jgi:TonB family protein
MAWAIAALMLLAITGPADAGDLATAKSLYAAASYEDALRQLDTIDASADQDQVDQYRALCQLALGRSEEAAQALERIVTRKPFYSLASADVSPRLLAMFRDVRQRVLPVSARQTYARAKANYDKRNFSESISEFRQMIAIVDDPDAAGEENSLADLKELGEGFIKLAEAELATAAQTAAAAAARTEAATQSAAAQTATGLTRADAVKDPAPMPAPQSPQPLAAPTARIYTALDKEVKPPVELEKRLPPWVPPSGTGKTRTLRGTLQIVVDEEGAVESAELRQPVSESYDEILLAAARRWRFRPATLGGRPVRYMKLLEIILQPRS